MKTKKYVLAVLFAATVMGPAYASGAGAIAGATLPEQIVQELTLVEQYAKQAEQLLQQIQMVKNQLLNLQNLPDQMWSSVAGLLQQEVQLVGNAKGLSYAAQNTVAAVQQQFGNPSAPLANYSNQLQSWTSNLDQQIASTLQQYQLNSQNFQTTQAALSAIQAASQSATGRMQVLQAGNQIAGLMVNQLQSLQSDIQAGNQVMLNALAAEANNKNGSFKNELKLLGNPTPQAY
jgi:P-type conjugative transfer protein TrbJ